MKEITMTKVEYIVKEGETCLCIEVETAEVAREIVKELIAERKKQGLTQQDIADRTGMKCPNVTRVESCKRIPTLDVLERYAGAVGKKLKFSLVDIN